jgi:hypothetical protein
LAYDAGNVGGLGVGFVFAGGDVIVGNSKNLNVTGDIVAHFSSDQRLKTNIELITDAVNKVGKLDGVTYNWNELANQIDNNKKTNVRESGLIAQQVEAVLPEVVATRENGYMAVKYEKVVPLLVEAIKELTSRVEKLEKQVKLL